MRARRHLSLIVVMMLAMVVGAGAAPMAAATPQPSARAATFATPAAAVREYLAGVAAADISRILGASAIDEMSTGFRFDLFTDRLKSFTLNSLAPAHDPFYAEVNRALQTALILKQVEALTFSLLSDVRIDGTLITPVDKAWAEDFARQLDPSRLSSLAVADIRFPNATLELSSRWLESAARQAAFYGADELTEQLVLFSFEGELYAVGFELLRYGDGWKVKSQNSNLAWALLPDGFARPTTAEEYDSQTSGEG